MANRNFNGVQINSSVTIVEKAKSDIADVRNRIVKYDEEGSIALAESGGDVPIGIAIIEAGINDISGAESGKVCAGDDVDIQIKDIGYIIAGDYIEKGNYVAAGPEGKAVKAKDGDFALGIAIGEAAEGEFCRVLISRTVCTKATPENGADHITFNRSDETGYGTKKVSDIVGSDVKIDWNGTKGKVTGTFPKVEDWKELPKEPKSGHFFAVKIKCSGYCVSIRQRTSSLCPGTVKLLLNSTSPMRNLNNHKEDFENGKKNSSKHPGRYCKGCFQTAYGAFQYGACILSE